MSGIVAKDHALDAANGAPKPQGLANVSQEDKAEYGVLQNKLANDAAQGARVLNLDEEATPEQKGAEAKKKMAEIKPPKEPLGGGLGMASDIGGKKVAATVSRAEADRVSKLEGQPGDGSGKPAGAATSTIPDGYQVGHTGVAKDMLNGQPALQPGEEEVRFHPETQLVSKYLSDQWYGRFYWDGAVILFAVLSTYFMTRFGGGILGMLVIGGVCTTYYNASTRRTRERHRDDISRELAKKHMMTENETAGWMNEFLRRFWLIYEPVLSATIIQTVDAILVTQCPSFLDSLRLTTFTLGTKAPQIDFVRTFPATADDIVCMDWKISFTPSDVEDLTVRQAARKINPKICLTVRIGKGVVGAGMPILIEDISFTAHARIKMKLISTYPHVQTVDVSLMSPPTFDFVLKPVGGNTFGFDIMSALPGLEGFVKGQVDANIGPMMYNPNTFTINLEELLSGTPLDTACGVLQVTIWNARNLKSAKLGGGTPDPYVQLSIDDKETLAKTKYKHGTANPQFKSTHFVLLNSLNGMLTFKLMDFNEHRPDSRIGQAAFDLAELEQSPEQDHLSTPVIHEGKERGMLQYSLSYYPVIKAATGVDGKLEPLPETRSGVVRLTVHQVKGLDKPSGLLRDPNPKARILLNGNKINETKIIKKTLDPIFEEHFEFLITDRKKAVVGIQVIDGDSTAGYLSVKLDDLLHAKERQQDWFPLAKSKEGRVRMSAEWKAVLMSGSVNGGSGYAPSIGVLKFHMDNATDVKNVEAAIGGKSDPYVSLQVRGVQVDGSQIQNNTLEPEFDEFLYAPVHSLTEKVVVQLLDYQNNGKPRPIGACTVNVGDLAVEGRGTKEVPYAGTGISRRSEKLDLGKGVYKGTLNFSVEFLPATNLNDVAFKGAGSEAANKAGDGGGDDDDGDDPDAPEKGPSAAETALEKRAHAMAKPTVAIAANGETQDKAKEAALDKRASIASLASVKTNDTSAAANDGITLTKEQLLASESGIIVYNILQGNVAKKGAYLEVALDDGYWPSYTTEPARTEQNSWDEVGEGAVKELSWSKIFLRLRTGSDDSDIIATFEGNTKDFLERALDGPSEFKLASDAGTHTSTVQIEARYIPCNFNLQPVESVNNTGFLRIELVNARNLRGADRGGKYSDPFVRVLERGKEVTRSKTIKKTLNPDFNEVLQPEVEIPSRVKSDLVLEVFDWDQVGTNDKLGQAKLNLAELEPFSATEQTVELTGKEATGTVTVRLVFRPEFIATRGRKGTSLNLGRTFTQGVGGVGRLGAAGVGTVGKGIGGVGKGIGGVGKGAFGLVRGRRTPSTSNGTPGIPEDAPEVPALPDGVTPAPYVVDGNVDNSAAMGGGAVVNAETASIAESNATGSPSRRRSRIHLPFRHSKHSS